MEYDVISMLYSVTGKDKSPILDFTQKGSRYGKDDIKDAKIYVGRFPECMIESRNTRMYTLNMDPKKPCVSPVSGYHQFRWVELTSVTDRKIYFLLSEKRLNDSIYERAKIFFYVDSINTSLKEYGAFTFNREIRVFRGMMSNRLKKSNPTDQIYNIYIENAGESEDTLILKKLVSHENNKISGTKPLVYDLGDLIYGDSNRGIPLVLNKESSELTLNLLKRKAFRKMW